MPNYAYDRPTALDSSFLTLERPNSYMHVASTQVFEIGPLRTAEGGLDAEKLVRFTEASLHLIPRYRQKLAWIPIDPHPVWVDDDRFNIDYHVRHTSLPKPGNEAQLKRLSARIMQQHLDRQRPLWEMWLVEGLEGDRFAVISKVHHCMIDGVSGVDLMRILLTLTPEYETPEAPPYIPRPAPSRLELFRGEAWRRTLLPFQALRDFRRFTREAKDVRQILITRARAVAETLGTTLRRPSPTPLNDPIGPHRRFDWLETSLGEIKSLRKSLGGSLNDIVLTIVTGAVRSFLQQRRVDPARIDFRILAPVSVRGEDEQGVLGNRISAWIVDLPVGEDDPRVQLQAISARTAELKASQQAVGAEVLTRAADWTPSTLLSLGARNVTRMLPFNMVVTNVPGPQVPMYSLGAKLLDIYPNVPLIDHLGLGVALMSYDGRLFWGFNADYDLVPDLSSFVKGIQAAFKRMRGIAEIRIEAEQRSTATPPGPEVSPA